MVDVLGALGWADRGLVVTSVVRAMCLPAVDRLEPFAGTRELLAVARELQLRVAVVSNAVWRDGHAYRQDFADLGLADGVDAYVSSVDVGHRKPHESMFRTALDALGVDAGATVMVGDTEAYDVTPAQALGMRAVLVAIEAEPPSHSSADAVCTSLADVQSWLLRSAG